MKNPESEPKQQRAADVGLYVLEQRESELDTICAQLDALEETPSFISDIRPRSRWDTVTMILIGGGLGVSIIGGVTLYILNSQ